MKKLKCSNTFIILLAWLIALVLDLFAYVFTPLDLQNELNMMCMITGIVCFTYMGIDYTANFFTNKDLPKGVGSVENIERFKGVVFYWLITMVVYIIIHLAMKDVTVPMKECIMIAGTISVEYIAGNKSNKIATKNLGNDKSNAEETEVKNE